MLRASRIAISLPALLFLLSACPARAGFMLSPDSVNRVIGPTLDNTHYSDVFSTYSTQKTLLELTNATLEAALTSELGPLSAGESYEINSAVLTVGSFSDNYATEGAAGAHRVLTAWDSSDVTWNEADADLNIAWSAPGLAAGVDYEAVAYDTGDVGSFTTQWSALGPLLQDWLDGTLDNHGLFFPYIGDSESYEFTDVQFVTFEIEAEIVESEPVPEPSSLVLLGSGVLGLCGYGWRRKRRLNAPSA
mgnify:CR=1 FL=1